MMLRVAKIPSLNVAPAAIDAVAEELRGGDKTKESIDDGVLRINSFGRRAEEPRWRLSGADRLAPEPCPPGVRVLSTLEGELPAELKKGAQLL